MQQKLVEHDLDKVDFVCMHGMFQHQLGNIPYQEHAVHDIEAYHALTRHLIFIGHVHRFSHVGRVVAHGSFDRLAHEEEEAKGYVRAVVQPGGDYTLEFLENTHATRFVTVHCPDWELVENLQHVERLVQNLPVGSHVRVQASPLNPILSNEKILSHRWPEFRWSLQGKERTAKPVVALLDHKRTYHPLLINRQTLIPLVEERLTTKQVAPELIARCLKNLSEMA